VDPTYVIGCYEKLVVYARQFDSASRLPEFSLFGCAGIYRIHSIFFGK
jgi:hypothetical protein